MIKVRDMKTLLITRRHGTWLDLSTVQAKNGSNTFSVEDESITLNLSPELTDVVKFARHNEYTHVELLLSQDPLFVHNHFVIVQDDDVELSKERALTLVEMLSKSNYQTARFGDCIFENKADAIAFIESDEYSEKEGIEVVFARKDDQVDSVVASYKNDRWYLIDHSHGGTTTSHTHLDAALRRLREGIDKDDNCCPVLFESSEEAQW